jgi:hypothetical protein
MTHLGSSTPCWSTKTQTLNKRTQKFLYEINSFAALQEAESNAKRSGVGRKGKESRAAQSTHGHIFQETNQPAGQQGYGRMVKPYLVNRRGSLPRGGTSPAPCRESSREQGSAGSTLLPWRTVRPMRVRDRRRE